MRIVLINDEEAYEVGDIIPNSCIVSEAIHGPSVLLDAEQNPEGEDIVLIGKSYYINKKQYDLASGYGIEAVIRDDQIIPKLRRAKGEERYALTRMVKKGPRYEKERIGVMNEWWPSIKKLWSKTSQDIEFVNEAVSTIEEIGEITEDFALPQGDIEDLEYYEEEVSE